MGDLLGNVSDLSSVSDAELAAIYQAGLDAQIALARTNINAFAEFVLLDEKTQEYVTQAQTHVDMHKFADTHTHAIMWGHIESGRCLVNESVLLHESGVPVSVRQLREMFEAGEHPKIWTVDHTEHRWKLVPVKSVFYNGKRPCVRVRTALGNVSVTSANHPYLAATVLNRNYLSFWREAANLTQASYVFAPGSAPPTPTTTHAVSPDEGFAVGYLVGLIERQTTDAVDTNRGLQFAASVSSIAVAYAHARLGRLIAERYGWLYCEHSVTEQQIVFSLHPSTDAGGPIEWLAARGVTLVYHLEQGHWSRAVRYRDQGAFATPSWVWTDPSLSARHYCLGYLLPGLTLESRTSGKEYVLSTVPVEQGQALMAAMKRGGVDAALRRSRGVRGYTPRLARVLGYGGDWTHFVHELISLTGVAFEHFAGLLPQWQAVAPLAMRPVKVSKVEDVGELETWGVEIDDPLHTHVTDGILTHNTQQMAILRSLWTLGHNPTSRIVIIQAAANIAKDTVTAIKGHIENNKRLRMVFPDLVPGEQWTTDTITVKRPSGIRTPSVQARGVFGKVLGHRYDLIIGDDIVTLETSRTAYMRARLMEWFIKEPFSRLLEGGQVLILGNAWHPEDLMHVLSRSSGWHWIKFAVRDPETKISHWPARWSQARIAHFELTHPPSEVARALDCIARSDEDARFKQAWIDMALSQGRGLFGDSLFAPYLPPKYMDRAVIATGVDLAFTKNERSDWTVLFTAAFNEDGTVDILDITRGRWSMDEILDQIVTVHDRFGSTFYVESNFGQKGMTDMLRALKPGIRCEPFYTLGQGTKGNKYHEQFGVERLAFEFSRNLWRFPTTITGEFAPQLQQFMTDLLAYTPEEHAGDVLMAAWMCTCGARDRGGFRFDYSFEPMTEIQALSMEAAVAEKSWREAQGDPEKLQAWSKEQAERFTGRAAEAFWHGLPRLGP